MTPTQTVLAYIEHINVHDVECLTALMSPDHRFVDSLRHSFHGREGMPTAWKAMVENGQLTHWQAYVENHPVREIMKKYEVSEDH